MSCHQRVGSNDDIDRRTKEHCFSAVRCLDGKCKLINCEFNSFEATEERGGERERESGR